MAEPSNADIAKMMSELTKSMATMQQQILVLQQAQPPPSTSQSGTRGFGFGEHTGDRPPRFQKLDFPKFDGKSDPLAFINRCESYFVQQRIAAEEQVWMASYNLEGSAQMWYIQVQQSEGTPSWRRFTELLNLRFGPPLRSNPMGELMACRRTGTVAEYQDRFEALLPRAGPLEEVQRIQAFTAGLGPPLSHDVEMQNPQTLIVAMSLARKLEIREQSVVAATMAPPGASPRGPWPSGRSRLAPSPAGSTTSRPSGAGSAHRRSSSTPPQHCGDG